MKNYQNITVAGREYGRAARKASAYWNEGKWEHFIEPFLPNDCSDMTFVDFGCNYGVHMRLAMERGFATVLGIEANEELREATDEYLGRSGQVLYMELDQNIFRDTLVADLPAMDFALMANFHYHVYVGVFKHLVNLLRCKTRYVIVVSTKRPVSRLYRAENGISALRRYFSGWEEVQSISGLDVAGDSAPRPELFSVLFKTSVERIPITSITWGPYKRHFYRKVRRDMSSSGDRRAMTYPILLRPGGSMADGFHRLASEELQGATTILAETA